MRRTIVLLLAALLAACSTQYAERRTRVDANVLGGISLEQVSQDTYRIFAQGNAYTSAMLVRRHAMRRAAKQAADTGYSGFYILQTADLGTDVVVQFPAIELLVQLSNMPNAGYYRASDLYP